jgi:predicted HTH domain antitoxin
MEVSVEAPDDLVERLESRWTDLSRHALEALAVEACREGILTAAEVRRMVGLSTRWETDALLKRAGAYLDYCEEDLRQDIETARKLSAARL